MSHTMTDMTPTLPPLGPLPEPTCKTHLYGDLWNTEAMQSYATAYGEQCARAAVAQQAEVTCRHCNGSGEAPYLSGGGPDAYDVTGPCATCKGTGAVAAPQQASAQGEQAQQASAQPTQAAKGDFHGDA